MSLKDSISEYFKIEDLKANFIQLLEAKFELKKIDFQEKTEGVISKIIVKILLGIVLFVAFLLFNLLIISFLNNYYKSLWLGYLIFIVFYLIFAAILYLNKSSIEVAIRNKLKETFDKSGI
jgi:uncharacterized membrane protein YqjE